MLKAILFDFNGVIIDDEPLHFAAMRETVAPFGVDLKRDTYWNKYLPLDDLQCLEAIASDHMLRLGEEERRQALERKADAYQNLLRQGLPLFPGAAELVRAAAAHYPLAIISGARRQEIESTLESAGLRRYFVEIAAAEDFTRGKPHPDSYLYGLSRLNAALHGTEPIQPRECLVIEDSVAGVHGARTAGMACMAVTNSYPRYRLEAANFIVGSLEEVSLRSLSGLLGESL